MHTVMFAVMMMFAPTAALAGNLEPHVTAMLDPPSVSGALAIASTLVAAGMLAFGNAFWVLVERRRLTRVRRLARSEQGRARAEVLWRDLLIENGREAIVILGARARPIRSFGGGEKLLDSCLAGADSSAVSSALTRLWEQGATVTISARAKDGRNVTLRGRPINGKAIVFLDAQPHLQPVKIESCAQPATKTAESGTLSSDGSDALNLLPAAIAVFGPDHKLAFANRAFASLTQLPEKWLSVHPTLAEFLDRLHDVRLLPEQANYTEWKRKQLTLLDTEAAQRSTELWRSPNGKTLRITLQATSKGGVLFLLEDISGELLIETARNEQVIVQNATLNALHEAIAVFGPDGRLKLHNIAFMKLWGLGENELCDKPHVRAVANICGQRFGHSGFWDAVASVVTSAAPQRYIEWGHAERSDSKILSLALTRLPDGATLAMFTDETDYRRLEDALREKPQSETRARHP